MAPPTIAGVGPVGVGDGRVEQPPALDGPSTTTTNPRPGPRFSVPGDQVAGERSAQASLAHAAPRRGRVGRSGASRQCRHPGLDGRGGRRRGRRPSRARPPSSDDARPAIGRAMLHGVQARERPPSSQVQGAAAAPVDEVEPLGPVVPHEALAPAEGDRHACSPTSRCAERDAGTMMHRWAGRT